MVSHLVYKKLNCKVLNRAQLKKFKMKYAWIRRRWLDFRQGHSIYLIFALSFTNFILIFYRLLIERVEAFEEIFVNLWIFAVVFILLYIPVASLIGFWHRRTQMQVEAELSWRQDSFLARNFRMLVDIMEGKASKEEIENFRNLLTSIEQGRRGFPTKPKEESDQNK